MTTTFRNLSILLALLIVGCGPKPPGGIYYASGKGSVTPDGLHLIKWEPFKVTYVKPGADLARYGKVLVQEVTVSYKTPPRAAQSERGAIDPNYALPDSALQSIKRHFHDEFVKALGRSQNFSIANAPGPDVLLLSGHIVNLKIQVPPMRDQQPGETDYTSSSGQMTLILDARDSKSGEPLVRVGQARAIEMSDGGWYRSDPVGNSVAVRQMFRSWAEQLQRELDQFHALPELPPAEGAVSAK